MHTFNIKHCKYCCICKYWYDPTNSAITPVAPNINVWGVATDMYDDRKKCLKTNLPKSAVNSCSRFECKLLILWYLFYSLFYILLLAFLYSHSVIIRTFMFYIVFIKVLFMQLIEGRLASPFPNLSSTLKEFMEYNVSFREVIPCPR